ncbi:MAG TPA: flagellar basal body-associated FliL family protein [Steroidobacteraceae bacterium]|jgi:flagellar FliL protein|nr:flagellar basal body-associated FliL family protein [Steroidobacteraceae bacterium]
MSAKAPAAEAKDKDKGKEKGKEAAAPSGKKKSQLPLIIIAAVVVLGGGGAGAWFAFKPKPAAAAAAGADTAAADKAKAEAPEKPSSKKGPPSFYKFDPAFVVNFGGEGSARYLQVTVEAMSRDAAILDELKTDEPAVRNDLVMLFSSQDNATLMSSEGKEKLRAATLDAIRKVLNSEGAKGSKIEAVYFTSFVIQ